MWSIESVWLLLIKILILNLFLCEHGLFMLFYCAYWSQLMVFVMILL